jgi:hypothetical protein
LRRPKHSITEVVEPEEEEEEEEEVWFPLITVHYNASV